MGFLCGTNRFEQRNIDIDDYNTLGCAFIGGDGRKLNKDIAPVD